MTNDRQTGPSGRKKPPQKQRRRRRPSPLAPATVAFIAVVTAIGFVTSHFGVEAGLLAMVLSLVALVIAPYVFMPTTPQSTDDVDDARRSQ